MAIVMTDPIRLRRVLNTNLRNYPKDTELSYKTFMDLLGTGMLGSFGCLTWARWLLFKLISYYRRTCDKRGCTVEETASAAEPRLTH